MNIVIPHHKEITEEFDPGDRMLYIKDESVAREALEPGNLRGVVDIEQTAHRNQVAQKIMQEKNAGKPGHYGQDIVIEGAMPAAAFFMTHFEYDGDPNWFKDDRKFQDFMRRRPIYSWLRR